MHNKMLFANDISSYKDEDAYYGVFYVDLFYIATISDGRFCKAGGNRIIVCVHSLRLHY